MTLAQRDLESIWQVLDPSKPLEVRAALEEVYPTVINDYGSMAGVIAGDFYSEAREASGVPGTFVPPLANDIPAEQAMAAARWGIGALFGAKPSAETALSNILGSAQRLITQVGRDTLLDGASRDKHKPLFARVPKGKTTCAFCLILASRGAVYSSKNDAGGFGHAYHDRCDCAPTPIWSDGDYPRGYNPDALEELYLNVHEPGMTLEETVAKYAEKYGNGGSHIAITAAGKKYRAPAKRASRKVVVPEFARNKNLPPAPVQKVIADVPRRNIVPEKKDRITGKVIPVPVDSPKLDGLPSFKPGYKYDSKVVAPYVNPNSKKGREWQVNCSRTSAVMELRRRGYDVTAGPRPASVKDNDIDNIASMWRTENHETRQFSFLKREDAIREMQKAGEGSRFFVANNWETGGGHIWNAEVIKGKVKHFEGQMPNQYPDEYLERSRDKIWILRVDDMQPIDKLVDNDWVRPVTPDIKPDDRYFPEALNPFKKGTAMNP